MDAASGPSSVRTNTSQKIPLSGEKGCVDGGLQLLSLAVGVVAKAEKVVSPKAFKASSEGNKLNKLNKHAIPPPPKKRPISPAVLKAATSSKPEIKNNAQTPQEKSSPEVRTVAVTDFHSLFRPVANGDGKSLMHLAIPQAAYFQTLLNNHKKRKVAQGNEGKNSSPPKNHVKGTETTRETHFIPVPSASSANSTSSGVSPEPRKRTKVSGPHECKICNKTFTRLPDLKRHEGVHSGAKPFQCQHCNKKFRLRSTLKMHERVHTGEKPYHCTLCNKAFSQSSSLNRHKRVCIKKHANGAAISTAPSCKDSPVPTKSPIPSSKPPSNPGIDASMKGFHSVPMTGTSHNAHDTDVSRTSSVLSKQKSPMVSPVPTAAASATRMPRASPASVIRSALYSPMQVEMMGKNAHLSPNAVTPRPQAVASKSPRTTPIPDLKSLSLSRSASKSPMTTKSLSSPVTVKCSHCPMGFQSKAQLWKHESMHLRMGTGAGAVKGSDA